MTVVALACENFDYDGAVFLHLLSCLWAPVEPWVTPIRFQGRNHVLKYLPTFLSVAFDAGVQYALVAIDNDGGARRHPEHEPQHRVEEQASDPDDGCAVCCVEHVIPSEWREPARRCCVAVPVQTLETWLLYLRGDPPLTPSPEQVYSRTKLKKMFFGPSMPPVATRREQALLMLQSPHALDRLRALRSFRHFEAQVAAWPRPDGT
ncbi:MAG: hypothetical protein EPO40_02415 [Myxococcaceae bacterium]|nr:MAG: hypothetical protein EPO40_02415 [Myxococcaceae bacterium]